MSIALQRTPAAPGADAGGEDVAGRRTPVGPLHVLALGSCRVHKPLLSAHRHGDIRYLNRPFTFWRRVYMHDVHAALQFVRLARGELTMPADLRPFACDGGLRPHASMSAAVAQADAVVIELCTDKHYSLGPWTIDLNELLTRIVEPAGTAGREWRRAIERRQRPTEAMVRAVEAALRSHWRARWQVNDGYRWLLSELAFRSLTQEDIADGLRRLQQKLERPLLVVPHVAVSLPDGRYLAERLRHVEKTVAAAGLARLPCLDPRVFVQRDGQARALDRRGTDYNHYARAYMPVVARELVGALRRHVPAAVNPAPPGESRSYRTTG